MIMKLLIIGSGGQLGHDFVGQAAAAGHSVTPVDYPGIDIRDRSSVNLCVDGAGPDVVINCAGFTAVDDCESEVDKAFLLNAEACGFLAAAAKKISALLVHFSTDYVFDGTGSTPYTEDSPVNPLSIYGKSKLCGDEIILNTYDNSMIFRTAWLYGSHGNNFVKAIRQTAAAGAREGKPLRVVDDQVGTPTWSVSLCRQALTMLDRKERGVFHSTGEGFCSWFDFAKEIAASSGIDIDIVPCTTEEFPRPARRPRYSVLENARLKSIGANIMPHWRDGFLEFLSAEKLSAKTVD